MSARVVNPFSISLTEMRRLREAVAARPASFRPDPEARARVCRNLYGKASAEDSRAFAARELTEQRERAAERWGFDFLREAPRAHGPGAERFKWTRVRIGTVPSAYKMPRLASLDAVLETARATVPSLGAREQQQQPEATTTAEAAAPLSAESSPAGPTLDLESSADLTSPPASAASSTTSTPAPQRQSTISDFFVSRKRPLSVRKHEETTSLPSAKRPRHSEVSEAASRV